MKLILSMCIILMLHQQFTAILASLKINHLNRYIFASNNYILFFVYTFLQKGYLRIPIQDLSDEKDDPLPPQSIGKFNSKTDASLCFL